MTLLRPASILVAYCLLTSEPAFGQPSALEETLTGEAKVAYDSALSLFNTGDYHGAFSKFGRAHELSHDPRLLWNMAVCEKHQHHYASAARYIQRHLDDAKELPPQERLDAGQVLAALEALFSYVWITNAPHGANIVVDEDAPRTAPLAEPLRLDLGVHTITISKPGFDSRSQRLDIVGGGQVVLDASLSARPVAKPRPKHAELRVTTAGVEDVVSIDGKVVGSHAWVGALTPGKHIVRVTASGKVTYERSVYLDSSSSRTLHVVLEDERSHTWYWLAGGTVLAVAGIGGYLLLRPEESDGPTGSLTTVYLP